MLYYYMLQSSCKNSIRVLGKCFNMFVGLKFQLTPSILHTTSNRII